MPFRKTQWESLRVCECITCDGFVSAPNKSKIGIVIFDRHLRCQAVNETLAKMHNLSVKQHLGRSIHQILGELSKEIVPQWESVFLTGKPVLNLEVVGKLPRRSGISHWIENIFPIAKSRGQIMHAACLVAEIDKAAMRSHPIPTLSSKTNLPRAIDSFTQESRKAITLSERERDVLRLLAEGKSNKEVSSVLDISVRTVEVFRARLMLKLQAPSFAHLVHYAIRNGIVNP